MKTKPNRCRDLKYSAALSVGVILPPRSLGTPYYEARAEACFRLGDWKGLVWALERLI